MNKNMMIKWMNYGHLSIPKVLLKHYYEIGLNEKQLILLLHVYMAKEEGCVFPTPEDLAKGLSFQVEECSEILNQLLKKGFLELRQSFDDRGVLYEYFSFDCLWEKLVSFLFLEEEKVREKEKQTNELNLYTLFEQEFNRPLSPIECEMLSMWIDEDKHQPEIIKAALKEAVISGKLNFRYIDRILFEWKKNGIETVEQAKAYGEKFRKHQQSKTYSSPAPRKKVTFVPAYNWLEQ